MSWHADPEHSVLIIDDDPGICEALTRILSPRYHSWTSTTIQQAHELLYANEFGLIIVDYQLNGKMDGVTFAEYIKTISPMSYVIMLTGHSDFALVQRALNEGNIDKFQIKPFNTHEFLEIVDSALAKYSSKREISQMLQSSEGIKMAQNLLTQVFDEAESADLVELELVGVVISRYSIPVYSRFLNTTYLKKFTDTIFSGFMTAIHMMGQEVFTNETVVDIVKFGQMSIYFKFFQQYQFCFIIRHDGDTPPPHQLEFFDEFVEEISLLITEDKDYFNAKNHYIEELDSKLNILRESVMPN